MSQYDYSKDDFSAVEALFKAPDPYSSFRTPKQEEEKKESWQITKGFKAGIDQTQAMGGGLVAAFGDALGMDSLKEWGLSTYEQNMAEAAENQGNVQGFTDIEGFGDAVDWALYTAGNMAPMLGASLVSGGAGALAAKTLAQGAAKKIVAAELAKGASLEAAKKVAATHIAKSATVGAGLGAYASSAGMETGNIYGDLPDVENRASTAFAHGAVAGALDALPTMAILKRLGVGKAASDQITDSVMKFAGKQMLKEGTTEGLQEIVNQHAQYWIDENKGMFQPEHWKQIIDASAAGALMGGVTGGATGLLKPAQKVQQAREETAEQGGDSLDQALAGSDALAKSLAEDDLQFNIDDVQYTDTPRPQADLRPEDMPGVEVQDIINRQKQRFEAARAKVEPEYFQREKRKGLLNRDQPLEFNIDDVQFGEQEQQPLAPNGSEIDFVAPERDLSLAPKEQPVYDNGIDFQPRKSRTDQLASNIEREVRARDTLQKAQPRTPLLPPPNDIKLPGTIAGNANTGLDGMPNKVGRMDSDPAQREADTRKAVDRVMFGERYIQNQVSDYKKSKTKEERKAKLPQGLTDERWLREESAGRPAYKEAVKSMVKELVKGGNTAYVRDANDNIINRTPSENPQWAQQILAAEGVSTGYVKATVDKAIKGQKPLGEKQARIISRLLDAVEQTYNTPDNIEYVKEIRKQKNVMRRAMREDQELKRYFDETQAQAPDPDYAEIAEAEFDQAQNLSQDEQIEVEALIDAMRAGVPEAVTDELSIRFDDPRQLATAIHKAIREHKINGQRQQGNLDGTSTQKAAQSNSESRSETALQENAGRDAGLQNQEVGRSGQGNREGQPAGQLEDNLLTTYTEADIRKREAEKAAAQEAEAKAAQEAEQKEKADRAVSDFSLTGSDRKADANPNQNDIFDAPEWNREEAEKTFKEATAFGTRPLSEGEIAFIARHLGIDEVRSGPRGEISKRAFDANLITKNGTLAVNNLTKEQRAKLKGAVSNLPKEQAELLERYRWIADAFEAETSTPPQSTKLRLVSNNSDKAKDNLSKKSIKESLEEYAKNQELAADDWANRVYKKNSASIELDGDGPKNAGAISISSANESRRRKRINEHIRNAKAARNLAKKPESELLAQYESIYDAVERSERLRFSDGTKSTFKDDLERRINKEMLGSKESISGEATPGAFIAEILEPKRAELERRKASKQDEAQNSDPEEALSEDEILKLFLGDQPEQQAKQPAPKEDSYSEQREEEKAQADKFDSKERELRESFISSLREKYQGKYYDQPRKTLNDRSIWSFVEDILRSQIYLSSDGKNLILPEGKLREEGSNGYLSGYGVVNTGSMKVPVKVVQILKKAGDDAYRFPEQSKQQTIQSEAKKERQAEAESKPVAKIEDFGEELKGAKKHKDWSFSKELTDADIAKQPLSKIWPLEEIDSIEDPFLQAFAFSARSEIPSKPRVAYKLNAWVDKVKLLRGLTDSIASLGGDYESKAMELLGKQRSLDGFGAKVQLLKQLDRSQWSRIGEVNEYPGAYRFGDEKKGEPKTIATPHASVRIDGRIHILRESPRILDNVDAIKALLNDQTKSASADADKFEVRGRKGAYFINRKGDSEYRKLKLFTDAKEAHAYRKEHTAELMAAWEAVKERDNVKKTDIRNAKNRPRTGKDYRNGKDVTPEQFSDAFGFRGVQFGNWVKQGSKSNDRQGALNQAYDALMDLSSIVGIPPKAVSLNGELGLAFGARGKGNASAHYEPGTLVINLTKTKGAGTLAHEWFHALDHYFNRQRGKSGSVAREDNYITYRPEQGYVHKKAPGRSITRQMLKKRQKEHPESGYFKQENWMLDPKHPEGVRPEVERAFADLVNALEESPMKLRAAKLDKNVETGYWSRIIERGARAFENYVIAKMQQGGYDNDYLANVVTIERFARDKGRYPYLLDGELKPVEEAFDALFSTIKTRETEQGIALFSRDSDTNPAQARKASAISETEASNAISRIVKGWKGGRKNIVLVDNFNDLPRSITKHAENQGAGDGNIRGVFHDGKIYLVRDMFNNIEQLETTLFHEAYGHYGLQELFGQNLMPAMNMLYVAIGGEKGLNAIAKKHNVDLSEYSKGLEGGRYAPYIRNQIMMEELFSHIAQDNKPSIKRRVKEIIGAIREWLRKKGYARLAKFNDNDIMNLLKRARDAARESKAVESNDSPRFMRQDEESVPKFSRTAETDAEVLEKLGLGPKQAETLSKKISGLIDSKWKEAWKSFKDRSYEGMFDGLAGLKRAEAQAGNFTAAESGYVGARLATGVADTMHAILHYGAPKWHEGILQYKEGTRGLLEIFSDLGGDLNNWLAWMGAHRAEELMAQGRENNLTQDDIRALKAKGRGKERLFEQVRKDYIALNKAMLDVSEEAGLIKPGTREQWESEYYVPFYRQSDMDGADSVLLAPRTKRGLSHQAAGIKALKGGETATNDLLENILTNWIKLTDSAMKNSALLKTVNNLKDTDFLTDESLRYTKAVIPKGELNKRIRTDRKYREMVADFLGEGRSTDVNKLIDKVAKLDNEGYEQMWAVVAPTDPDIIRVQRDGKNEYYRVNDESLLRAVTHLNQTGSQDPITKTGRYFKRMLTTGVTASPDFILRNFIRDAVHAWAINPDGFKFAKDSMRGLKNALKEDNDYRSLMFAGASFQGGYVHGIDPEGSAHIVRRALEAKGLNKLEADQYVNSMLSTPHKMKNALESGWQKYRNLGDKIENANRLATFKAALAAGKPMAQAVFESKDLMDYSLRGNFAALQWFTDVIPFLNARLQGLSKLGRAAKENPRRVLMQAGIKITAFSVALAMLNDDDERYQELPDWDKDANWHFFIGDEHFRIPKPFEIGIMFGTIPERMYHTGMGNQENEKLLWSIKHNLFHTLNINPIPQFVMPVAEVVANRSFFFDTPIEGMADEGKLDEARYSERTSSTMKEFGALGKWVGLSPKELEHLWNGYLGTMGSYGLMAADMLTNEMTGRSVRPEWKLEDYPVIKSFYKGSGPAKSTQYMTDVYDRMTEVDAIYRTIQAYNKEGRSEDARELRKSNMDKLRHRAILGRARKQLGDINKQMERISLSDSYSASMKRVKLDQLRERKNEIAKRIAEMTEESF